MAPVERRRPNEPPPAERTAAAQDFTDAIKTLLVAERNSPVAERTAFFRPKKFFRSAAKKLMATPSPFTSHTTAQVPHQSESPPPHRMSDSIKFIFVPFIPTYIQTLSKNESNALTKIVAEFSKWCESPLMMKGYYHLMYACRKYNFNKPDLKIIMNISSFGYFILYKNNTVLSIASVASMSIVSHIATNPEYRNQGYATMLLKHIQNCYSGEDTSIVWSPVDNSVTNLFENAGWTKCNNVMNKDNTYDYCPAAHQTMYKQLILKKKDKDSFGHSGITVARFLLENDEEGANYRCLATLVV